MELLNLHTLLDLGRSKGTQIEDHGFSGSPLADQKGSVITPLAMLYLRSENEVCPQFENVVCGTATAVFSERSAKLFGVSANEKHSVITSIVLGSERVGLRKINLVMRSDERTVIFQAKTNEENSDRSIKETTIDANGIVAIRETHSTENEVWEDYRSAIDLISKVSEWRTTRISDCVNCPVQESGLREIK